MNLSPHFTLEAFTASDTAARLAIDNSAPAALIQRLRYTTNMLEVVRDDVLHGLPVLISSGYRCAALLKYAIEQRQPNRLRTGAD